MRIIFSEQVEVQCRKDELEKAMAYLSDGKYTVQVITYNQMTYNSGRGPGMKIVAARVTNGGVRSLIINSDVDGGG